jgi:hypothetical protein
MVQSRGNKRVQPFLGAENRPAVVRQKCSCSEGGIQGRDLVGKKVMHGRGGVKPEQERSDVASLVHGLHDDAGYIIAKQAAPRAHEMIGVAPREASSICSVEEKIYRTSITGRPIFLVRPPRGACRDWDLDGSPGVLRSCPTAWWRYDARIAIPRPVWEGDLTASASLGKGLIRG